jgi:hypothetical protein
MPVLPSKVRPVTGGEREEPHSRVNRPLAGKSFRWRKGDCDGNPTGFILSSPVGRHDRCNCRSREGQKTTALALPGSWIVDNQAVSRREGRFRFGRHQAPETLTQDCSDLNFCPNDSRRGRAWEA